MPGASPTALDAFIRGAPRLFVLTGAGCSTASGIPDYRDEMGEWKHRRPVQYQDFVSSHASRQKYWARSLVPIHPPTSNAWLSVGSASTRLRLIEAMGPSGLPSSVTARI